MNNSRTKNSIRNIIFSLITNVSNIILKALVQILFLKVFAVEYLGLNSLFSNIISVLSIAESGIGLAIVFAMYKPFAEHDDEKIKQLLNFYKKVYAIIASIILILGLILTFVLKFLVKDYESLDVNFYIVYFLFLINTLISYISAHRKSLFYVNQRNDIEQKILFVCNIVFATLQLIAILVFKNFYMYVFTNIINTLLSSLLVFITTNILYKHLIGKPKQNLDKCTAHQIKKNVLALFSHRIGGAVLTGTDSIIISAFIGIGVLGKYSNYLLIVTSLGLILSLFTKSTQGSIGNAIATKSKDEVFDIYKKINFLYIWLVSFCTIGFITLSSPFVSTVYENNLVLNNLIVIVIGIQFYLQYIRNALVSFKDCCGLFWENRKMPIIEAIINLIVSIVMVHFWGLLGVLAGTIISNLLMPFWVEPKVLYKCYFNKSVKSHYLILLYQTLVMILSCSITMFLVNLIPLRGLFNLILKFIICIVSSNLIIVLCYLPYKDFRMLLVSFKSKIFNIFKKNK